MSTPNVLEAIERMAADIAADPAKAQARNAPATARLVDGLRCELTGPRGERLLTDMPPALGGGGTAPNPGWLMRGSLASCAVTLIAMRAARLGIRLSDVEVTVDSDSDLRGILGLDPSVSARNDGFRMKVRISAPGQDEKTLRALVEWADAHSPVTCTMRESPSFSLEIEVA